MPTYEYTCQKCNLSFECVQSMKEPALTTCPREKCLQKKWGKGKVKRGVGGGTGLIFKGSGFYITDYRSEGYKSAAKNDSAGGQPATPTPAAASTPTPAASGGGASGGGSGGTTTPSPSPKPAPQKASADAK